jgi:hypothetical protein
MSETKTIETIRLPSGNTGIRFAGGDVADPAYITLKNLVAMGQERYDVALAWVVAERQRAAVLQAERETRQAEDAAWIRQDAEARAAAMAALKAERPWVFD